MAKRDSVPGRRETVSKRQDHDNPVVKLLYDQPISAFTYLKRKVVGWYTVYSYTFVFNLMDWWEQLMMHFVLWTAVGLAAWGVYHQGFSLALLARSFVNNG